MDDSEESRKLVQEYQVQLKDAEESLAETEWSRFISQTGTLLDDLYSDYEEVLNARLDDISLLISDMINMVNSSGSEIENAINNAASEVGYSITRGLSGIIGGNNNMLSTFNGDFNTYSTNVQTVLGEIKYYVSRIVDNPNNPNVSINNSNGGNNSSNNQSNTANKINSNIKPGSSIGVNVGDSVVSGGLAFYDDSGKFAYVELENGYKGWVDTSQIFSKYNGGDAIIAHVGDKAYSGHIGFYDDTGKYAYVQLANGYTGWVNSNELSKGFNPADSIKVNTGNEDVNGNLGFYDNTGEYAYVELENGYKGWVLTSQLKEYAKGSKRIDKNQLAWTQENGSELIYRASDGALLTPLGKDGMVFTHEMSENLWKIAQGNLPDFMSGFKVPTNIAKVGSTSVNNQNAISINLPNVTNYTEFKTELQKDSKFIGFMQEVTLGQALGKNKLNKNKY